METKQLITNDYITKADLPYHSDSSNDSAITCEFDEEDALQDETKEEQNDDYYDDRLSSTSDFKELIFNFTILGLENPSILNNYRLSEIIELIRPYYKPIIDFDNETQKYSLVDRFGFIYKEMNEKEAFLQQVLIEILNSKSEKAWTYGNCENLKTLVREYGIPNELRPKIWLSIIENKVSNNYNIENLLQLAEETIQMFEFGVDEMNIRQIDLDICRTMPNHQMFNEKANGLDKLKRILVAYSIHINPNIGYCQYENHALMGLICIIDYCFPANYFDENLTGARADQMLLRDLILKKLTPRIQYQDEKELQCKLSKYSSKIDEITGSLSLNWFLSLFHNAVPWQTRLYILDCFWLEGMKVLFRFGLALLPLENKFSFLDSKEGDNRIGDLINQMKDECARYHDVELLRKIAFRQLTIPGRRELRVKRSIYLQKIQESLQAAKDKEEKFNESINKVEEEIELTNLDQSDEEKKDKVPSEHIFKKNFKRSNSAITAQQPPPANRLNWLKKRLSLANFYPLSMQDRAAAQKNAYRGLNGIRSCEAISRNGQKLVQMITSAEHHQSRVNIQLRDTHYSHIFYPNRRSSIVLTDSEQHHDAIQTLRNLYNKDLLLVGVSDDGKWIVLLDQLTRKFHSGWLKDSNFNVLILSVPFAVRGWYFDELSWQVICLDKENQLWRCDLADPSASSLCTDFLKRQLGDEPKSIPNYLNMLAYDDKYCLLWVHMVTKISPKDQTEEAIKRNSLSERMTLSFDFSSAEDLLLEGDVDGSQTDLTKKEDTVFFKSSMEDLDDDEEEDQNDLCSCGTENTKGCDHQTDRSQLSQFQNGFQYEAFRSEYLENNKCVKNCAQKRVSNSQHYSGSEPIASKLLSRRVTLSEIFRRNSLIIVDSNPLDHSNLADYLISKHGHANLSHTAKDQLKEQQEFQCTVRFALENRIRMHKLFEIKHRSQSNGSMPLSLQTQQHSQQTNCSKRSRKHIYHQENHKNDDLTKIDTTENLTRQQLFVFDTCSMELFGILKLDPLDGQLQKIYCLSGVAYCGFEDGSIVAITVTLSGSNEQPTNRRQLLQPQPEDEITDLRVFSANDAIRMDTIIQQTLASRSDSMSSKESINSSNRSKSKTNSSSIDEEDDDDEELIHFDVMLLNNLRKNSKLNSTSVNNEIINSIGSPMNSSNGIHQLTNDSDKNANSMTNSVLNSSKDSKEIPKKISSSSEHTFELSSNGIKKFENLTTDGTNGTGEQQEARTDQTTDRLSSPTRFSRTERNLPSLATIFNNSLNSAFLVLALFKSGKLHCIHLKNGCVQERKLFKLDSQLKSEVSIENLRIVNAFRMNWSEDDQKNSNLNELITDRIVDQSQSELDGNGGDESDELHNGDSVELKSVKSNGELNNNEINENNRNLINETIEEERIDQNGQDQIEQATNGVAKPEHYSSQSSDEFEQARHKLSKRSSINVNKCNYLVTLWSPHPTNRLINIKL